MLRPLQKKDQNGNLYTRSAAIEAMIGVAIKQNDATLVRRAGVPYHDSPDYLASECLVYLIRDAFYRHDKQTMSSLLLALLARCEATLRDKLKNHDLVNVDDIVEDILGKFSLLLLQDLSGEQPNQLDYFECRFNSAFRAFRIDYLRGESKIQNRTVALPTDDASDADSPSDAILLRLSDAFGIPLTKQQDAFLANLFLQDLLAAIDSLPTDEREAVVLCHILGYKVESDDSSEITAAIRCHVTGRTIRNRLARAVQKLSRFKEKI